MMRWAGFHWFLCADAAGQCQYPKNRRPDGIASGWSTIQELAHRGPTKRLFMNATRAAGSSGEVHRSYFGDSADRIVRATMGGGAESNYPRQRAITRVMSSCCSPLNCWTTPTTVWRRDLTGR